jgi:hypothetical protein
MNEAYSIRLPAAVASPPLFPAFFHAEILFRRRRRHKKLLKPASLLPHR